MNGAHWKLGQTSHVEVSPRSRLAPCRILQWGRGLWPRRLSLAGDGRHLRQRFNRATRRHQKLRRHRRNAAPVGLEPTVEDARHVRAGPLYPIVADCATTCTVGTGPKPRWGAVCGRACSPVWHSGTSVGSGRTSWPGPQRWKCRACECRVSGIAPRPRRAGRSRRVGWRSLGSATDRD